MVFSFQLSAAVTYTPTENLSNEQIKTFVDDMTEILKDECQLPEKIHSLSAFYLFRFLSQLVDSRESMLTTAMRKGVSLPSSAMIPVGACIAAFVNLEPDSYWEKDLNWLEIAKKEGIVPRRRLKNVDSEGNLTFELTP